MASVLTKVRPSYSIYRLASAVKTTGLVSRCLPMVTLSNQQNTQEGFIAKNKRLGRPTSPHLMIYKFELPGLLSGSHRVTGFIQSGILSLAAIGLMFAPENFEFYVNYIQALDLPRPLLATGKMLFAWPFVYHTFNGIRHLAWDVSAKGLRKNELFKTGYLIFLSSLLATGFLVWKF